MLYYHYCILVYTPSLITTAIGALFGHEVHILMPDWVSLERKQLIEMYGAKIHLVSREDGGFKRALEIADEFAEELDEELHHEEAAEEPVEEVPAEEVKEEPVQEEKSAKMGFFAKLKAGLDKTRKNIPQKNSVIHCMF
mgnify:CR=1 FL=1